MTTPGLWGFAASFITGYWKPDARIAGSIPSQCLILHVRSVLMRRTAVVRLFTRITQQLARLQSHVSPLRGLVLLG